MSDEKQPFEDDIDWLIQKNKGIYTPPTEAAEEAFAEKVSVLCGGDSRLANGSRNIAYTHYLNGDLGCDKPVRI